jgi:hypothetical protein
LKSWQLRRARISGDPTGDSGAGGQQESDATASGVFFINIAVLHCG